MRKYFKLIYASIIILTGSLSAIACGDDDPEPDVLPAPKLVSTTPANGTEGLESGNIDVAFVYDMRIICDLSQADNIIAQGCTVANVRFDGNSLLLTAICPSEGGNVSITVPNGFVMNARHVGAASATLTFSVKATKIPQPDDHFTSETAAQAVSKMAPGWNLGNTLDTYGAWIGNNQSFDKYETGWGQPLTDAHLMKALKKKGFNGVRVPVTWMQHMDANGKVDEGWMKRVQEIVDYVLTADMYCILNVHHDTGAHDEAWVRASSSAYADNHERYAYLWKQIAERFKNYNERLLFEGYNEMLDDSFTWNQPRNSNDLQYTNRFAQDFVDAVRSTGGNNRYRNLVVTTYSAAHGDRVLSGLVMPTDPCGSQDHLAVEVHSYDPWDWVNTYNMRWTNACTKVLNDMFSDLNRLIIQKGYPVIVGEYGTNGNNEKTINGSSTAAQKAEAGRQAGDMNRLCRKYGAASFYWMGLIEGKDRSEATFRWTMEQVADSIVNVYK